MKSILNEILTRKKNGLKSLAVLLDPDKLQLDTIANSIQKINDSPANLIFIGGSTVAPGVTDICVKEIKKHTQLPLILFPGDYTQLTPNIDAVLFISLLSGRNPEYLIDQHIKSVPFLQKHKTECIPTGYILIDGGTTTATQKVSNTLPIPQQDVEFIKNTALAGEYKGKQLIYLEAGSGAKTAVSPQIIRAVSKNCNTPIIVGGGLRSKEAIQTAFDNGADIAVIGTIFEEDTSFLKGL